MRHDNTAIAAVIITVGDADGLIWSGALPLMPDGPLFSTNTAMNIDPSAKELAQITEATASLLKCFGVEPKVAMLSRSNFGASGVDSTKKARAASRELRDKYPTLLINSKMQVLSALNPVLRDAISAESRPQGRANLLVMPNLNANNMPRASFAL